MKEPTTPPKKVNILVRLLALFFTIALTVGAFSLVVYRDEINMDSFLRWMTYRKMDTSSAGTIAPFTHAGGDSMDFASLSSGVVLSSQIGANYYSLSGTPFSQQIKNLENPILESTETAALVYDAGGQSLYLFADREMPFTLTLDSGNDLLSARINEKNWLAVTAQQNGYKGSVTVYDSSYEKIIQINLSSTFVVDAMVSPDCKTVAIITIGQTNGIFESQLLLYPVNSTEPSATLSLGNTTVLDLDYESDQIWVLGESQLMCVTPDGTDLERWPFDQYYLKGASFGGDGFATLLLGYYRVGSADLLVTIGENCVPLATYYPQAQVLSMDARGRYISLLSTDGLTVYTRTLESYASLLDTAGAKSIAQSADGSVLLADDQEIWRYLPTAIDTE